MECVTVTLGNIAEVARRSGKSIDEVCRLYFEAREEGSIYIECVEKVEKDG